MSKSLQEVAKRYGRHTDVVQAWIQIMAEREAANEKVPPLAEKMYSVPAYSEPMCVIIDDTEEMKLMQWGLIPRGASARDIEKYNKFNWFKNARGEDIFETWPFKFSIRHRRCLIPSTGFFEYHYNEKGKAEPWYVHLPGQEIFSMGGVWDEWTNTETGEKFYSFVQITTEANELMAEVHNGGKNPFRMPFILAKEDEARWLDPNLTDDKLKALIKPYPADKMDAYKVNKNALRENPYDPDIIQPSPGDEDQELF